MDAQTGIVKVIDFGLAKDVTVTHIHLSRTGALFGTEGCISPEQAADGKQVDHRTDFFSFGRSMIAALQNREPTFVEPWLLPEPWKTLCLRLISHNPEGRYPTAQEAIDDALLAFNAHGLRLTEFDHHAAEIRQSLVPASIAWPGACQIVFAAADDVERDGLVTASALPPFSFGPPFDANAFLLKLESSSALKPFIAGVGVGFEACDRLGTLYANLYAYLGAAQKEICFRRLCRTAVRWNRYSVMINIRHVYEREPDPDVEKRLLAILAEEDPSPHVIHGRGVIPGRAP